MAPVEVHAATLHVSTPAEYDRIYRRGVAGPLELGSFNAFYKEFKQAERNLPPDQLVQRVMLGDLGRCLALADLWSKIDPKLEGRLAGFRVVFGAGDRADADIDLKKIVETDFRHDAL